MSKTIIAIIALIMVALSISSVSGQSVTYGTDANGYRFTLYNYGTYAIYDYGLARYIDYFGHGQWWETWNGNSWQYYSSYSNNYGSPSYYSNQYPQTGYSSGHDYVAEQAAKNQKIYDELDESMDDLNKYELENGWSPSTSILPRS